MVTTGCSMLHSRVLQECDIDVLRFEVDKDEPSRLKLYKRLVSKLIPKWTMHYLHSEYHYDITVINPKSVLPKQLQN